MNSHSAALPDPACHKAPHDVASADEPTYWLRNVRSQWFHGQSAVEQIALTIGGAQATLESHDSVSWEVEPRDRTRR